MTLQKLASNIAKLEGKKSQAKIGDVREMLKSLCQLIAAETIQDVENGDYDTPYEYAAPSMIAIQKQVNKIVDSYYKKQMKKTKTIKLK